MVEYDVVIIGSGIAGMTAAIYLKRAGLNTLIIENNAPGGQLLKGFEIENYPGFLKINSTDLGINIYNQTVNLNVDYFMEEIISVDLDNKIIITSSHKIKSKYIVISTGRREKKLNIENEDKLLGRAISFCATCDGYFYKDKKVVVVGGSNTAITEALYLGTICKSVTVVYRGDEIRAEEILKQRIKSYKNIDIVYNSNIMSYNLKDNKLLSVTLDNGSILECDGVFLAIGFIPNSELFDCRKENGYIVVDDRYQTSKKDIYACGDVILKNTYQLTTAASDATIVSSSIVNSYNGTFR